MTDSNARELLQQINHKLRSRSFYPLVIVVGLLAVVLTMSALALILAVVATFFCYRFDKTRRSVVLMYDLDADAQVAFEALTHSFDQMTAAQGKWIVQAQGNQGDWKRHAGATISIQRTNAFLGYKIPPVIKTNVSVPCILGGRQNLYFFPDFLCATEKRNAAAIDYQNLAIECTGTRFVEDGKPPSDAAIAGKTWKYLNKSGGPDRRFKNNRQLPIALYQEVHLHSSTGLSKTLQLSRNEDRGEFRSSIARLGQFARAQPGKNQGPKSRPSA